VAEKDVFPCRASVPVSPSSFEIKTYRCFNAIDSPTVGYLLAGSRSDPALRLSAATAENAS